MADIALLKYLQYIDSLIDDSRLAEAVAHSRHVLEQHPRYVAAYRTLGKALLEQGDYAGAVDVFQRVLSAVPDDFIAHVGLAIVHKAGNRAKQALWHMERAFEVEPYNPAIRSELQELYGRRDGLAPEQPELTRGALARLHVKSGLYQQATLELRELLRADPERVDLRLLLAEALWRAEERVEAADVCRDVLDLVPDCLQANAILADILLQMGEAETAAAYLRHVQELSKLSAATLDPAAVYAQTFSLPGAISVPREIWVDRLSDEGALGMGERAEAAAWMDELDLEAAEAEDDLDWLRELQEAGEEFLPPEAEEERLDWLQDSRSAEEAEEATAAVLSPEKAAEAAPEWAESVAGEEIDWTARTSETGDLPAWLVGDADDLSFLDEPVAAATPDWLDEQLPVGEEEQVARDLDDELAGPAEEQPAAEAAELTVADESVLPAADELGDDLDSDYETVETSGQPGDETVLEELAMDIQGNEPDELPDDEEQEAGIEGLDWLEELGAVAADVTDSPHPEWSGDEAVVDDGMELDWLDGEGDVPSYEQLGAEPPASLEDVVARSLGSDTGDSDAAGEDLSWLDQIAGGQAEPPEEMPTLEWPEDEELAELTSEAGELEPADEEPVAAEGLDWLDAIASDSAGADDAWLDELAVDAEGEEESESSSEPRLFTDDVTGIDWLDELESEPDDEAVEVDEGDLFQWFDEGETAVAEEGEPDTWAAEDEGEITRAEQAVEGTVFMWDDEQDAEAEPGTNTHSGQAEQAGALARGVAAGEDEFTWLDELDAEGEAGEGVEPATAVDESAMTVAEPEWLEPEPSDVVEDEAPELDWLDAVLTADEPGFVEAPGAEPEAVAVDDEEAEEPEPAPHLGDGEAELEEAMNWLNEVPEGAAVAPEEAMPQDLEEAMAWLDAGADEAGEEVASGEVPGDLEEAMAWLDAGQGEAGEEGEIGEVPEDLDEAMAWLEQLAAQQGAPVEELPSVAAVEQEAEAEVEESPEVPEVGEVEPEPNLEWMETLAAADEPLATEELPTSFAEDEFDVPEDLDEAMAWLEGLAAQQGAPLEELPSVQADEGLDFEEAVGEDDFEVAGEEAFAQEADEGADIDVEAAPEELEEAMAWLDELAAQQAAEVLAKPELGLEQLEGSEARSTETYATTEGEVEPELVFPADEDETPESTAVPDVAMMYLDSLMEHGGEFGDEAQSIAEEEPVEMLAAAIPDDPEAALAWLEELASGAVPDAEVAAAPAAADLAVEEESVEIAEPEPAAFGEEEFAGFAADMTVDVDEVPEDPDEVMAWLERLAARQGASLDELPTVDEYSEEVETPDWLASEIAELGEDEIELDRIAPSLDSYDVVAEPEEAVAQAESVEEAAEPAEPETDESAGEASWLDDETGLEWLDAVTSEAPSEGLEWLEEQGAGEEGGEAFEEPALSVLDDELDDLMPDWLTMDEETWEEPELGITSWLAAEEELSQVGLETPPPPVAPVGPEPIVSPEPEPVVVFQRIEAPGDMDASRLEAARAALDQGEMDGALGIYQELLDAGAGLNVIIADLELATDAGYKPALCRVLGDAYMQNGQLNRALEVYRKALDLL
jgi:tetratricopeptide (TPR) repeat protein